MLGSQGWLVLETDVQGLEQRPRAAASGERSMEPHRNGLPGNSVRAECFAERVRVVLSKRAHSEGLGGTLPCAIQQRRWSQYYSGAWHHATPPRWCEADIVARLLQLILFHDKEVRIVVVVVVLVMAKQAGSVRWMAACCCWTEECWDTSPKYWWCEDPTT
jgi:hypothetical protein